MEQTLKPEIVEKEAVSNMRFPSNEVLTDPTAIKLRSTELERGTTLGNIDHYKIKIVFEDDTSVKQVETTIWANGQENIVLKKGVTIPVHRIHRVKII
ncbi:MAG: hypothetical protein ACJAUV_000726 [Flavobacteriales bacterium]|jgi:uncharacterized protein (UPF0248 family)